MCLALRASGLWLRYATLQNLIPSFPWIAPHALHPGAIQGKEGIKFCHLATLITDRSFWHFHFSGRGDPAVVPARHPRLPAADRPDEDHLRAADLPRRGQGALLAHLKQIPIGVYSILGGDLPSYECYV